MGKLFHSLLLAGIAVVALLCLPTASQAQYHYAYDYCPTATYYSSPHVYSSAYYSPSYYSTSYYYAPRTYSSFYPMSTSYYTIIPRLMRRITPQATITIRVITTGRDTGFITAKSSSFQPIDADPRAGRRR